MADAICIHVQLSAEYERLPRELLLLAFRFCNRQDLVVLHRVSKRIRNIARADEIWQQLLSDDFGCNYSAADGSERRMPQRLLSMLRRVSTTTTASAVGEDAFESDVVLDERSHKTPFQLYRERYMNRREGKSEVRQAQRFAAIQRRTLKHRGRIRIVCDYTQYVFGLGCPFFGIPIALLLLYLKLTGKLVITFMLCAVPIFVMAGMIVLCCMSGFGLQVASDLARPGTILNDVAGSAERDWFGLAYRYMSVIVICVPMFDVGDATFECVDDLTYPCIVSTAG
jgi:hypothetical protein